MTQKNDIKRVLETIGKGLDALLLTDQVRIKSRMSRLRQRHKEKKTTDKMVVDINKAYEAAAERALKRRSTNLTVEYPENLPISSCVDDIKEALTDNQLIIVCGTTGSGKTTQLPKIMFDAGCGKSGRIGCTQPRRLAASSMARRVAKEMRASYGQGVGCQVRFDDMTTDHTIVKFMTDGILLAETRNDKMLLQYDCLIIDEAHERSLNIDFILGYIKDLLPRRPDLKVVISSATLDAEGFSNFFQGAPVIQVEGRTFPVDDYFMPPNPEEDLNHHIVRATKWIGEIDKSGDILVFLPGEREIKDAAETLEKQNFSRTEILPLFGRLSTSEQQRVFQTGGRRRIVLATNVAETSITIPGIHYVIDSGLVRISRYNPRTQVQSLLVEQVSKASARQRRGRCGRVAEGVCVYLYDEETFEEAPDYTDPEIQRTSLSGVILQMAMLGLPPIEEFPLIDPPQDTLVREGYRSLIELGALTKERALTNIGREIASFPVDPHMARMICQARSDNAIMEVLIIVAFLSIQDPRERPAEKKELANRAHKQWMDERSDFMMILNLWNFIQEERESNSSNSQLRKLCKANFLNYMRIREWFNLVMDLARNVKSLKWDCQSRVGCVNEPNYDFVHRSILAGLPRNLGVLVEDDPQKLNNGRDTARKNSKLPRSPEKMYTGMKNKKFVIFPGSSLSKMKNTPKWIMAFALMHTSKLFARIVAEVNPEWLEQIAPHMCKKSYKDIRWNSRSGFVTATEMVMSGGLLINPGRKVHYGAIDPAGARKIFIEDGLTPCNIQTRGKWLQIQRKMLKRVEELEIKLRRPGYLLDIDAINEHFNKIIPENVCSTKDLEKWLRKSKARIAMRLEDAIIPMLEPINFDDYPDKLFFYEHGFKLKYSFAPGEIEDGVCLYCNSDDLGMLPDWACDWIIPAWLPEKVRLIIRTLPKQMRVKCNPIQDTVNEFIEGVESGEISREQLLLEAIGSFVQHRIGEIVTMEDFDIERLPRYLIMKVAEVDDNGNVLHIGEGLPDREQLSSKLSSAVRKISDWIVVSKSDWPAGNIPESISLDDDSMVGYPALVDEGNSVGQHVFMDKREATVSHRCGLVRLFRLLYAANVKMIEKNIPLTTNAQLSISMIVHKDDYTPDFVDSVIIDALTDEGRYEIRDKSTFERRAEIARADLFDVAQIKAKKLGVMLQLHDSILSEIEELNVSNRSVSDVENQLEFLFRFGFLKQPVTWERNLAYLKALKIRVERLTYAPDKDITKLDTVQPFQDMLDKRISEVEDLDHAFGLLEFAELLQEFRIAQFAPEVSTNGKVSAKRLNKLWRELI